MSEIKVNNGNIEDALKRFKRQCARNGVLQEVRKREHYEKWHNFIELCHFLFSKNLNNKINL